MFWPQTEMAQWPKVVGGVVSVKMLRKWNDTWPVNPLNTARTSRLCPCECQRVRAVPHLHVSMSLCAPARMSVSCNTVATTLQHGCYDTDTAT